MFGIQPHVKKFWRRQGRRIVIYFLLGFCLILPGIGCSMLPGSVRDMPGKIGLRSREAELRAKVEADSFPTAKEAGL
jgi:hypothetical protein